MIGLALGIDFVERLGLDELHRREMALVARLRDGLAAIPAITLYCADDLADHLPVLTANVAGLHPQDVGAILDGDFGIAVRVGVHCAPLVHRDLGTIDRGAVRFSLGAFTTAEEIDRAIAAMNVIAQSGRA